jgi:hypothetical protein
MDLLARAYHQLPESVQPFCKRNYYRFHPDLLSDEKINRYRTGFINEYFESEKEYSDFIKELNEEPVVSFVQEAITHQDELRGKSDIGNEYFHDVYAYLRKEQPDIVVETGVRDGWSTLYILLALHQNDKGTLYSIDYPIRAEEHDTKFKKEAPSYSDVTPTIPAGTDPGWIVPENLKNRWNLVLGKSQEKMPELVCEIDEIDVFIHDSDHSLPCMIFEYELAWDWLGSNGIIFSDDIDWNDGFDRYINSKDCRYGKLTRSFGYIQKDY